MFRQFALIIGITYLGNILSDVWHLPIPGTVIGMLILFFLLYFKFIKLSSVEAAADTLISNLAFLFIPPAVALIAKLDVLRDTWGQILFITVVSTAVTLVVTGYTADILIRKGKK